MPFLELILSEFLLKQSVMRLTIHKPNNVPTYKIMSEIGNEFIKLIIEEEF